MTIFDVAILPAKSKIYSVRDKTVQSPWEVFSVADIRMILQWCDNQ